jgi:hypothetical protein
MKSLNTLGYTKSADLSIVNSPHFQTLNICPNFSFLCGPKYKVALRFYTIIEYILVYIQFFFSKFSETCKCRFVFFLKKLQGARAPKRF